MPLPGQEQQLGLAAVAADGLIELGRLQRRRARVLVLQPVHQQQDNTYKYATLVNGMEVMVPQFIRPGEVIRIEVATGKYVDRVRTDLKRV